MIHSFNRIVHTWTWSAFFLNEDYGDVFSKLAIDNGPEEDFDEEDFDEDCENPDSDEEFYEYMDKLEDAYWAVYHPREPHPIYGVTSQEWKDLMIRAQLGK